MDKFIEKVMYELSGMRNMENYYPYVLKRTIELARIHPDLHFDLIDGGSESYVVFASESFTHAEAYEYVKKRKETLVYLQNKLASMTEEQQKAWGERYRMLRFLAQEETSDLSIALGDAKLYLHSNYTGVDWETEEEEFYNNYYDNEIENILISFGL